MALASYSYCILPLKVVAIKHTAVTKKKDSMRAMALDSENNQIQVKDIVKVIDGPHSVGLLVELSHLVIFTCLYLLLKLQRFEGLIILCN